MFVFLALVAVCNAQLYGQSCDSDADCDGGFCLMTTCRPYSEKDEYCNLYRKCKDDHVCKQNICVDNTCAGDYDCDAGFYCGANNQCALLGETGDKCDDVSVCGATLKCVAEMCVPELDACAAAEDCSEDQYCDQAVRTCFDVACSYDSDCSDRYFCHDAEGRCTLRPSLGQACGGEPFMPCQGHLRCDSDSGVCEDPAFKLPCADLNGCEECTGYGSSRCVWADETCSGADGGCGGLVGCVEKEMKCPVPTVALGLDAEGNPAGTAFDVKYDSCTRDLDCPIKAYCHNGDPRYKDQGFCVTYSEQGVECGGTPEVKCASGLECVIDGHDGNKGVCVPNKKSGFVRETATKGANTGSLYGTQIPYSPYTYEVPMGVIGPVAPRSNFYYNPPMRTAAASSLYTPYTASAASSLYTPYTASPYTANPFGSTLYTSTSLYGNQPQPATFAIGPRSSPYF